MRTILIDPYESRGKRVQEVDVDFSDNENIYKALRIDDVPGREFEPP